jgi:hypothetical protein
MNKENYDLYKLRHNLIEQDMRNANENMAIKVVENWYEGKDSEKTVIRKLIKLNIIKE